MFRWTPYTFLRIAAFFIGGILLGVYNPGIIPLRFSVGVLVVFVVLYFLLFFLTRNLPRGYFGMLGLPAVFIAGYIHVHLQKHTNQSDHLTFNQDSVQYYRAVITTFTQEKLKSWKTEARLTQIYSNGQWIARNAKLLFYFPKADFEKSFAYGDVLLIKGKPALMTPPSNPGEFDYKRYLSFRNIYHQHFLRKGNVKQIGHDPPSQFIKYAFLSRAWCQHQLETYVTGGRERAVASALVLGVTDGLDNDLLNAYSATGAMHVLAVSGLHISILYMIIMWVLKPLSKLRSGPWLLAIISLILLWLYAFITGISPSVLRAVTMFTFVALSRPMGHTTNIFNTLGASAFCLLLFDPHLIMSVGFQLSYLAVFGIVYLQPGLYQLWTPTNYLLDEIWKITCVSIAAQLATFSLGLLYFHQFPNYFLLSNLLVIPGSFVVLVLGILLLAVCVVGVAGVAVGFLLTWSIKFINYVVFVVEAFPFSLVENIYINTYQSWLIMIAIVMMVLLFQFRKFQFIPLATASMVLFAIEQWTHHIHAFSKAKFTVYNVQGHTAFDLMENGQTFFFTDSILINDKDRIRFHIHPNRLFAGIQTVKNPQALGIQGWAGVQMLTWKDKTIALMQSAEAKLSGSIQIDILIVGNNAWKIDDLQKVKTYPRLIILDSSNSYFYTERFLKDAIRLGLKIHSVRHHGAYQEFIETST
ncbi:MAG TPA: ComEC/Rec2 family competence protein [Chryseosolibacter sp.]